MKKLIACLTIVLLLPLFGMSQDLDQYQEQIVITGQVIDVDANQPLIGCHIFLSEEYITVSKKDGMFELSLPAEFMGNNLYFSYVGYETNSKPLNELVNRFSGIEMNTAVIQLEEIVVIADPWSDFRDIIAELSILYPDKEDLMKAILEELQKFDSRSALAEPEKS
jgi:hypothetical protein